MHKLANTSKFYERDDSMISHRGLKVSGERGRGGEGEVGIATITSVNNEALPHCRGETFVTDQELLVWRKIQNSINLSTRISPEIAASRISDKKVLTEDRTPEL